MHKPAERLVRGAWRERTRVPRAYISRPGQVDSEAAYKCLDLKSLAPSVRIVVVVSKAGQLFFSSLLLYLRPYLIVRNRRLFRCRVYTEMSCPGL